MIKVGIIGTGFIGPVHLEAIRRLGVAEVVAVCDTPISVAKQKAAALNVPYAYDNVDELLKHPGIEVIHNCTPNYLHAEVNRKILRAGKHVFSEKPLCMTVAEAEELVAMAESAGSIHGVSFVYRHFAMVQQAASMMRHREIGQLFAAQGSYLQDWMLLDTDYNWRVDAALGGSSRAVADIGSHWCDTIQSVTGRKITEVMADLAIVWPVRKVSIQSGTTFGGHSETTAYEEKPVTTEDRGSILIRFDDGSKGCFSVSQVSAGRKNQLSFEIDGSAASLGWNQEIPQQLWVGAREHSNRIFSDDPGLMNSDVAASAHFPGGHIEGWPDAFKNMMGKFYAAVQAGKMPDTPAQTFATFHDGAYIMKIIDAIVRSHAEQRWIRV